MPICFGTLTKKSGNAAVAIFPKGALASIWGVTYLFPPRVYLPRVLGQTEHERERGRSAKWLSLNQRLQQLAWTIRWR